MENDNLISSEELLNCFLKSCFFLHDDVISELKDNHDNLIWDQYSTNPLFLGVDTCVVDSLAGFGDSYLEYLDKLKCLPNEIIIPSHKKPSLLENLLTDEAALSNLRYIAQNKKLNISSFYSDKEKNFEALIKTLAKDYYLPRLIPSKLGFIKCNDKIYAREQFEKSGVPIPDGLVCYSQKELLDFWKYCKKNDYFALVKKYHWQTQFIKQDSDISRVKVDDFPVIIERGYDVKDSPVSHFLVWENKFALLFVAGQVVENWKHYGNALPHNINAGNYKKISEYSRAIAEQISEYEGILGVDFLITNRDEIFAIDLNPRFNSSTYPLQFLKRMNVDLNKTYMRYYSLHCQVHNLSDIFKDEYFIKYDPITKEGIILMTPFYDFNKDCVTKFFYLIVANSSLRLQALEDSLTGILKRKGAIR